MKRIVVTGIGLVTPLAGSTQASWDKLVAGKSGISRITRFDVSDLPCQIAGQVPREHQPDGLNNSDYVSPKDHRKMDDFMLYGMAAASQAIADSGWVPSSDYDREMTGVMIGSGIGGLPAIESAAIILKEKGPRRLSPFFIPSSLINLVSGNISIKYGFTGPNHAVVTACSSGAHAIGDAARLIQYGDANVMIAGGAEGAICRLGVAGFSSAKALSTNFNDSPEEASRPWDRDRDGFVMGEGSGIVVLEELEHAKKRGAHIYGELIGYGLSGDGYHITAPHPEGSGGFRAMQMAIKRAQIDPNSIDYINAHGTSTPLGDEIELAAVHRLFGAHTADTAMSSTKSSIGHLLGAAGSVEAIFSLLAMKHHILPPTLNLHNPPDNVLVDLVPKEAKEKTIHTILSNSFGFGGTNASLIFTKYN
jgi:3-oxoacyl-[acyl-carrier-protein] synthase II